MISHFLIDTLYSRLARDIHQLLGEKGCVKVFEEKLESTSVFEKTVTYACKNSIVFLNMKGDSVFIDLLGESSEELFVEIGKILPVEYSFARRIVRGLGDE